MQQEEQFGVCQWTHCAAPPVANRQALTLELKLSLKPGGGRDCLFSKAVIDQCCGADLCRRQKLLLLSEGTLEQLNLALVIHWHSGIDHRATWRNSDPYVMIHK